MNRMNPEQRAQLLQLLCEGMAIRADTKLVFSVLVGDRDAHFANAFMDDVASRLSNRVQLTSDGHKSYLNAVEGAFGADVDYAPTGEAIWPRAKPRWPL